METDLETTKIRLDKNEFKTGNGSGRPVDIRDLADEDLETWSQQILEKIFSMTQNR